jgi:ATP-dependent DNA helicase RecQ
MLRPYSGQWSVGAKHLEDKLSVIAKNSSPNASPVQLSVVKEKQRTTDN